MRANQLHSEGARPLPPLRRRMPTEEALAVVVYPIHLVVEMFHDFTFAGFVAAFAIAGGAYRQ